MIRWWWAGGSRGRSAPSQETFRINNIWTKGWNLISLFDKRSQRQVITEKLTGGSVFRETHRALVVCVCVCVCVCSGGSSADLHISTVPLSVCCMTIDLPPWTPEALPTVPLSHSLVLGRAARGHSIKQCWCIKPLRPCGAGRPWNSPGRLSWGDRDDASSPHDT